MQIHDGKGSGKRVQVDSENRLRASSTIYTLEHLANHANELAFNATFRVTSGDANVAVLYLENESDIDLVIEQFTVGVDAACELWLTINNVGTRNAPTDIIPVNMHAGSGKDAVGTFEQGTDLTGGVATLSAGDEVGRAINRGATPTAAVNAPQDIILPKNRAIVGWCDTAGIDVYARVAFNYHNSEGKE